MQCMTSLFIFLLFPSIQAVNLFSLLWFLRCAFTHLNKALTFVVKVQLIVLHGMNLPGEKIHL